MDNYKVIERKLAERKDFRGNSLCGITQGDGRFEVYSYGTRIATFYPNVGYELVTRYYSRTTSKQQAIIARAWFRSTLANARKSGETIVRGIK